MDYKFNIINDEEDEELNRLLDEMAKAYNNLMVYMIKKELGYTVEVIDDEHIVIDGKVMNSEEFQDWLDLNYPLEDEVEEDPHHYDA